MNAPEFPTSPRDTETKGEVEKANVSSCCVRAAGTCKRELKRNQKKSVSLHQRCSTLYNVHLKREACIPAPFPFAALLNNSFGQKIKWRKRLCHGLLYLLSVAEHHSHG